LVSQPNQESKAAIVEMNTQVIPQRIVYPVMVKDCEGLLSVDGVIRIAMAGAEALNGDLKVLDIIFESKEEVASNPEIKIDWLIVNGGKEKTGASANNIMSESQPERLYLLSSSPNPFSRELAIRYSIPKTSEVDIKVYNSNGQIVQTLVSELKEYGRYTISWNGTDTKGKRQPNGIYFVRMAVDDRRMSEKVILTNNK